VGEGGDSSLVQSYGSTKEIRPGLVIQEIRQCEWPPEWLLPLTPLPPPRVRKLSLSQSSCAEITRGGGMGEEPNQTTERKPGPV